MPEKVAALRIERLCLGNLTPHPRNPRTHPEPGTPAWNVLRGSLERDYFDPIVLNERNGLLVSGHLRLKVLIELGFTHADVSVVDYDEATHLARMIAANSLLGEWEADILAALAKDISAAGIEAAIAGWDEKQMASRLDGPAVDDDTKSAAELVTRAEELQREWQVKAGDVYQIGVHRLLCGDCTLPATWRALLGAQAVDLWWADPPYNVAYQGRSGGMLNDDLGRGAYLAFMTAALGAAFTVTKPGAGIYVAHADSEALTVRAAFEAAGWKLSQCLVWVKNHFTLARQDYQWQHEPILYGWKPGAGHYWQGGFAQSTVIDDEERNLGKLSKPELIGIINRLRNARETTVIREAKGEDADLHPTIKPLPLVARHVHNSSRKGELVADLCGGSGTTLMAAEQTGRRAVAPELDPKFCAVILQRFKERGIVAEKVAYDG